MRERKTLQRALLGRAALAAAATLAWLGGMERGLAQGLLDRIPSIPGDWTVTLGALGKVSPEYEGAKQFHFTPIPIFALRRTGKAARFSAPLDGPSISLIDFGGFYFGPTGRFKQGRKEKDYPDHLRGLGNVDWTIEVGAFAEFWPSDWLRTRVEVRHGFGGHKGVVADLSADAVLPFNERWSFSGGPRLSFANTKATTPYFAIDASQALASGLPLFNAKGGLHSIGAGIQARYQLTPKWEIRSYAEYSRLMADAASSPLVAQRGSRDQVTFGLGVSYSFDVKLW